MAITSMDELVAALTGNGERIPFLRTAPASAIGPNGPYSLWKALQGVPGVPTSNPPIGTGEACGRTTAGAIPFTAPGTEEQVYLAGLEFAVMSDGMVELYDRLVHTGGLSGTAITAQTVNSAALPARAAGGAGVEAWLECYTALGATSRTATVSYTNQAGTAGRTGTVVLAASTKAGEARPISMQSGDTGVRSVESVTLSATTGTVGEFGVTLLRRLASLVSYGVYHAAVADAFDLGLQAIDEDACLAFMVDVSSIPARPLQGIVTLVRG